MNLLQAMRDPNLFARWFRDEGTWAAWRAFLGALFALPLSDTEAKAYRACTSRQEAPEAPFSEAWLICGRRAGKSFVLALIAVYLATFRDYRPYLQPGERATILIIATDRKQARAILNYLRALLTEVPMLARLVERETADEFDLTNRVTIEVGTSSFRSVRGRTLVAGVLDEMAFWPTEDAADPDFAILDALRPAMATIPNGMLLCASSPYARRGALWDAFNRYFGKDDPNVLVWRAPTRVMNPSVPQRLIDEAYERDPAAAAAEYGAEFRTDVERFVSLDVVDACIAVDVFERPPSQGHVAFVDPSGGSGDSMTLAIAHPEGDAVVLDAVRECRPPFSPDQVVEDFATLLKSYKVSEVMGDRYAGEWPRERFKVHGIQYVVSEKTKSDLYRDLLPMLNSGRASLLDHQRLRTQIVNLERRTARGGRDSIDHPRGAHDDVANAVAGALVTLSQRAQPIVVTREQATAFGPPRIRSYPSRRSYAGWPG
ncbi:hypothetical protein [Methylobacterium platani]|uniref:Terminase n=2 Tax=Methylobacterium platani TaxID=427683 RepID=A0A179RZW0_9HYPH|nr:hypothetical protein [Methylobacterium platani]KMO17571.1 hypothetical protein SQ03_12315 [Methylobacterium platani JCM 14648]OAS18189.1 hypothetical protein A5481_26965 [Methylobacterium platani]